MVHGERGQPGHWHLAKERGEMHLSWDADAVGHGHAMGTADLRGEGRMGGSMRHMGKALAQWI